MLRDSVVVVVVVRTRPQTIPLAMITMREILHGFPFLSNDAYGAPLGGPLGRQSSAKKKYAVKNPRTSPGKRMARSNKFDWQAVLIKHPGLTSDLLSLNRTTEGLCASCMQFVKAIERHGQQTNLTELLPHVIK